MSEFTILTSNKITCLKCEGFGRSPLGVCNICQGEIGLSKNRLIEICKEYETIYRKDFKIDKQQKEIEKLKEQKKTLIDAIKESIDYENLTTADEQLIKVLMETEKGVE